jgi:hypothetical protein
MNGRLALVQELWSNAAGGCDKRLGAPAGSALELNFPASVDFGPITPGATATPNLVIQNSTASEGGFPGNQANVFYVDLASGSNPAFSTPFAGGATIAAGGSLNIPLQIAAPATHGTLTGTVEIWTDDTSEAQPQTVPLVAEVGATPTPVQSATPSPSVTPSATASPGATPSPAPSSTPTPLPSASPSPTPSPVVEAGPFTVKGPHKLGVIADGTFGRIVILTVAAGKKLPGNKRAGALAGLSYSLVQTAIIQIVSASSTCVQGGGLAPGQKCAIAVTADATGPISFPLDKKGHPLKARIGGAVIVSASNVIPPQKDVETHTESVIVTPPRN